MKKTRAARCIIVSIGFVLGMMTQAYSDVSQTVQLQVTIVIDEIGAEAIAPMRDSDGNAADKITVAGNQTDVKSNEIKTP